MFTGIISHLGKVDSIKEGQFTFSAPVSFLKNLKKGSSVAVNGVCLTITSVGKDTFFISLMPETLRRTTLGTLKKGEIVNLELPLSASGRFEGHIVLGHVDGMAEVVDIKREGNSRIFTFKISRQLIRFIVEKGSIAVNGISLTVIEAKDGLFTVGIIPYTWGNTMIRNLKAGDKVDIEVDILAKYVEKLLKIRSKVKHA